jgi:hypothetical protein
MGGILRETPVSQNPLVKKCGQVKRDTHGPLTITTYKTFAHKNADWKTYGWDGYKTVMIPVLPPPFMKDDILLLVKTYNQLNRTSSYDLYTLDEVHICGYGRDTDIVQRNVYMDKKWL